MQSLYEWDFNAFDESKLGPIVEKNIIEFGPGLEETEFIRHLVRGVKEKLTDIDKIITVAAPEWPINQVAAVDRNVLRLGLFELLFGNHEEVPPKVAINEAIELAKSFGGETSGKFVNGVLGTVYREIGEPGKEYPTRAEKAKQKELEEAGKQAAKIAEGASSESLKEEVNDDEDAPEK
jgi:N utilization substance protein B